MTGRHWKNADAALKLTHTGYKYKQKVAFITGDCRDHQGESMNTKTGSIYAEKLNEVFLTL